MAAQILNLPEIKKAHQRFLRLHEETVAIQLNGARKYAQDYAFKYPRFIPRSPNGLREATKARMILRRNAGTIILENKKPYAAAIDEGARPHAIRGNPFLRFFWAKKGRWVTARKVNHPGNKPYRFLYGANVAAHRYFGLKMNAAMNNIAKRF